MDVFGSVVNPTLSAGSSAMRNTGTGLVSDPLASSKGGEHVTSSALHGLSSAYQEFLRNLGQGGGDDWDAEDEYGHMGYELDRPTTAEEYVEFPFPNGLKRAVLT
jgi:hypothetical protein